MVDPVVIEKEVMNLNQVDPDLFRRVMGCFATGVAVITTAVAGDIHGMTANAFMSASLSLCRVDRDDGAHARAPVRCRSLWSIILERRAAVRRSTQFCLSRQDAGARAGGWRPHRRHPHHGRLWRPHAVRRTLPAYGGGGPPTLVVLCRPLRSDQPTPADRGDRAAIVLVSATGSTSVSGAPAPKRPSTVLDGDPDQPPMRAPAR
jgi:hypothetical protein